MDKILTTSVFALLVSAAAQADPGGTHVVSQENKAFSVDRLVIKAGESVRFPNQDPFYHNVFSLSSGATFDLGSYAQGEERKVTFDEPGKVLVECAIHPSMQMTIEITE